MRYTPTSDTYHKFIGEDEDESGRSYYHTVGVGLYLYIEGELGELNRIMFSDVSWNMKLIYSRDSSDFVPDFMFQFSGFVHVFEPDSSDDDS